MAYLNCKYFKNKKMEEVQNHALATDSSVFGWSLSLKKGREGEKVNKGERRDKMGEKSRKWAKWSLF